MTNPENWTGTKPFIVRALHPESGIIKSFYLAPKDGAALPAYRPGQFLGFDFAVPGHGGPVARTYTLSDSGPKDGCYRISVKREPEGVASKHLHDEVGVGSEIPVRAPSGDFYLDDGADPLVLLAGGVGVTPLLAMVNHIAENLIDREAHLFHAVLNSHVQAFGPHLKELANNHRNIHLHVAMDQPAEGDASDIEGRLDVDKLKAALPDGLIPDKARVYMCGPVPFMKALYQGLRDAGMAQDRIHYEFFGDGELFEVPAAAATASAAGAGGGPSVSFSGSGKDFVWDGSHDTLLELAEANGVTPPFSCRSGFCHTCKVPLVSGEIEYNDPSVIEPEADEVLLCCSSPKGDVVIDA